MLIIDEIPAVSLQFEDSPENIQTRLETAQRMLRELVARDKNHPSVILWSVANEPMPPNRMQAHDRRRRADRARPPGTGFPEIPDRPGPSDRSYPPGDPGGNDGRAGRMAGPGGHRLHQPLLGLVYPARPAGKRRAAARTGAGRASRGLAQTDRDHRVWRGYGGGDACPAAAHVLGRIPGGISARLPGCRRAQTFCDRPARLEFCRLSGDPIGDAGGRDEPQRCFHPRTAAEDGGALPARALDGIPNSGITCRPACRRAGRRPARAGLATRRRLAETRCCWP